jgi:tetratricopeptide (TPR) repeat protein
MTRRKASVATIDPNAEISFEALVGAPLYALIEGWEMLEGSAAPSPELIGRVEPLLESVAWLAPTAKVGQLHAAIRENDPRALGTLTQLDSFLKQTFGVILTRCAREAQQNDWAAVRREAVIAARIAGALAFHSGRAHALFYVAKACRLEGDLESTVAAYEQAITAASASGEEQLVAVAQDNLGNALADLGRLDEALSYYEESLKRERRPGQRACILTNKANVLGMLGELRWAAHTLQAHVSELEQAGVSGQPLALALDNAASQITLLGEHATALSMYERAQSLFDAGDIEGRIINAQNRAKVHMQMENRQAAAEVFQEAHDLVFEHARRTVNPEHYRQGFRLGLAAALPTTDDVYALFAEMVRAAGPQSRRTRVQPSAQSWRLHVSATTRSQYRGPTD